MKKLSAVIVAFALISNSLLLTSCSKKNSGGEKNTSQGSEISAGNSSDKQVIIKKYSFPEFLKNTNSSQLLANPVFESFNKDDFVKKCKEQKFEGKEIIDSFGDLFYSYRAGIYMGLLNSSGEILFEAASYTNIDAVSDSVLEFSDNENQKAYVIIGADGSATVSGGEIFNADSIETVAFQGENTQYKILYSGGYYVNYNDSDLWDSVTEINKNKLKTQKEFTKCFKVSRNGEKFYICFDSFGNYSIYNCEYAHILVKVGSDTGECYVHNPDDYKQLKTLTDSFGQADFNSISKSDEKSDYIQITFGINDDDKRTITVSPSGLCFTEKKSSEKSGNKTESKYFSCLDKECFGSLIEWIDKAVSGEFA